MRRLLLFSFFFFSFSFSLIFSSLSHGETVGLAPVFSSLIHARFSLIFLLYFWVLVCGLIL
ncbi:hypothetical protein CIPAW_11G078100 [Carya illinoinensis]|uniref:Uncharacterized protein n=1 Tax=Carya illinoinensis TaxID=32201 RepID=A0A8T1P4U0_CARIL|nr:hypothetical protein CIPAW_11G078100 [Carya illinoinensis]